MLRQIPIIKVLLFKNLSFLASFYIDGKQSSNFIVLFSNLISVLHMDFHLVLSPSILNFCVLVGSLGALGDILSYIHTVNKCHLGELC